MMFELNVLMSCFLMCIRDMVVNDVVEFLICV